jgi:hypothetical protein
LEQKLKKVDNCNELIRRNSMPTVKEKVVNVFNDRVGEKFLREEIIDLVVHAYPETPRGSVIPSDYCYT